MNSDSNRNSIIKNASALYFRMLFSMAISLYTSRIVLSTLGETDFGIYGIVGDTVAIFIFLNTCMSSSTSRFLTFEMGRGSVGKLKETFNTAMIVHIAIAVIVFILAETVGMWLLSNKLEIPESRMAAAHVVYQCSILGAMLTITQVPYNAAIIAHEKMEVYAYVELLNTGLKLLIVYFLAIGDIDKLKLYAILMLGVNFVIILIYRGYCTRKFRECTINWKLDKDLIKPMLSFSLWDLYGNMAVSFRQQGTNILINIFFGAILNTSSAIATMVQRVVSGFSNNVIVAFRPRIIKSYSAGNLEEMQDMMIKAVKFSLLMLIAIVVPLSMEVEFIMELWLGDVPQYAPVFCKIMLGSSIIGVLNTVLTTSIHSTGKIRSLSFIAGTVALMTLPVTYSVFRFVKDSPELAYYILFTAAALMIIVEIFIVRRIIPELNIGQIVLCFIKIIVLALLSSIVAIYVQKEISPSLIRTTVVSFSYLALLLPLYYIFILDRHEKKRVVEFLKRKHFN